MTTPATTDGFLDALYAWHGCRECPGFVVEDGDGHLHALGGAWGDDTETFQCPGCQRLCCECYSDGENPEQCCLCWCNDRGVTDAVINAAVVLVRR